MTSLPRRSVLRGIAGSAFALGLVGQASAGERVRYIVTADGSGVEERIERAGFTVLRGLAGGAVYLVAGPADERAELEDVPGVADVAADLQFELETPELQETADSAKEPFFPLQWDKQDITTDAVVAHDRSTGEGATVAIVDSGVEFGHPDLADNVDPSASRQVKLGAFRGGTGEVTLPADPLDPSEGTTTETRHVANDVYGHGTHVAGIAAASVDDLGVVGTAPDADVVSLRVGWWTEDDDGNAVLMLLLGDVLAAIDYAAGVGADATNLSLGTVPLPPGANAGGVRGAFERVLGSAARRGSVVVSSVGNAAADLQRGGDFVLPAGTAGSMAVSATGPNDELAFYSNYGTNVIDVGAPGGGYETLDKTLSDDTDWPFPRNLVLSAMDPDTLIGQQLRNTDDDSELERDESAALYAYIGGTSMAAPQVAGTVALVREIAPDANARKVRQAIEQGAELVRGKGDPELGAGRLNADRALDAPVLNGKGRGRGN